MDRLAAMRLFVEIADRGSLTAAARSLGRSLPTVVRILAALEEHLGCRLLQRTTRRSWLTEEGRDYLERCRRILADVEDAERAVGQGQGEPRGRVRVTAPVLFGQRHVAPAVVGFLKQHPAVEVELRLLDRVVNMMEEGIDLAVRIGPLADSSMVAVPVSHMRRVVCASPGLLAAGGVPAHPEELRERPCVRFRGLDHGPGWRFRGGARELVVPVSGSFSCDQAAAAADACSEGLGFGMFLAYQVADAVAAGRLEVVLADFEPPPVPVSLVYPQARLVSSRLRALRDWLRAALREAVAGTGLSVADAG